MKKILITGSTGFIGSYLTKRLLNKYEVIVILRKKNKKIQKIISKKNVIIYKNFIDLDNKLSPLKIDYVIHCATHYVKEHKVFDIKKLSNTNIAYGNILLENLKKLNVKKFINFSTVWEDYNGKKNYPNNLYAFYKKCFSELIKYYSNKNNVKFYNLMISDTFGHNDKRKKLINLLNHNYKKNITTNIISSNLRMNLLSVNDIFRAVKIILDKNIPPSSYTLIGNFYNIKNIIDSFNLKNKKKIKVKYLSKKIIIEKIYRYKKLPNWCLEHSSINEIFKIIKA